MLHAQLDHIVVTAPSLAVVNAYDNFTRDQTEFSTRRQY